MIGLFHPEDTSAVLLATPESLLLLNKKGKRSGQVGMGAGNGK